jgi:hypothetical protein
MVVGALVAAAGHAWAWRVSGGSTRLGKLLRLCVWFLWPGWLLALWTWWRWRHHLIYRHIAVPSIGVAVALLASMSMAPPIARCSWPCPGSPCSPLRAADAQTIDGAAIDWFSVFFFTVLAIAFWVFYAGVMTGVPAKAGRAHRAAAARIRAAFSAPCWQSRSPAASRGWRSCAGARHARRHAVWKSLVLPASGWHCPGCCC